jgi:glutamate-1-semialdehyde 2,1-aminomutase
MNSQVANPSTAKRSAEDIYEQACKIIPGGVSRNTVFHKPHPFYAAHASGCYVTDIDGIQRLDFANNMASLIHGHAHPAIVNAVTEQLHRGTAYTMATESEVALAQLLCDRVESIEQLRFTNSGTEAVMAMMKAARLTQAAQKLPRPKALTTEPTILPKSARRPTLQTGAILISLIAFRYHTAHHKECWMT